MQKKEVIKKEDWFRTSVWIVVIAIIPASCVGSIALEIGARDPAPWFAPSKSNIVGKWEFTPYTSKVFEEWTSLTAPKHELVFNDDGTFYVNNLPIYWRELDTYKTGKEENINGSGTWYLGQTEGTQRMEWIIFTQFQDINGQNDNRQMRFYFQGHLPSYTLVTMDAYDIKFNFKKKLFDWK